MNFTSTTNCYQQPIAAEPQIAQRRRVHNSKGGTRCFLSRVIGSWFMSVAWNLWVWGDIFINMSAEVFNVFKLEWLKPCLVEHITAGRCKAYCGCGGVYYKLTWPKLAPPLLARRELANRFHVKVIAFLESILAQVNLDSKILNTWRRELAWEVWRGFRIRAWE